VWDFAGGGPYLPIDMGVGTDARKDAVVVSAHKFLGGPGASGVLVVNRDAVRAGRPTWPGGGTVAFVSPWAHDYSAELVEREEAGTPNVIGDIRAALAFLVKDAVGTDRIAHTEARWNRIALDGWGGNPRLQLLGTGHGHRLPIYSFVVRDEAGAEVDPQLFARVLSDRYGIQVRGGCACAGPYGHRLLGIGAAESERLRGDLVSGRSDRKPGWVRLNFSYAMDEATVLYIVGAVNELSQRIGNPAWMHGDGQAA
jgi:selenocysteine lyase/cysteine desulfurase